MPTIFKVFIVFILVLPVTLKAQHKEFGLILGTSNYQGEVATTNDPEAIFNDMRSNTGVFYRWYVSPKMHFRTDLSFAVLHAEDQFHSNPDRGLRFNSNILEFNFQMEYNFRPFYQVYKKNWTPYAIGGIGFISYDALIKPEFEVPTYIAVAENSGTSFTFSVGGGIKYKATPRINIGLEAIYRVTTKDDIDGYINTFSAVNDNYYHINLTFSRTLF